MIHLENVMKMSWRYLCNTSWRRFEEFFNITWQEVLKMSWIRLQNVLRCLEDAFASVLKTYWRRHEDVWPRQIYWSRRLENVLNTSSEGVSLRWIYSSWSSRLEDIFWRRRRKTFSRLLQDVFMKTNVCWEPQREDLRWTSARSKI